jgi:prolyl oligopeptidase
MVMRVIRIMFIVAMSTTLIFGARFKYPDAPRGTVVEEYHGTKIADPYRWLEDPDSPEARRWIDAENKLTHEYLSSVPNGSALRKRLAELWSPVSYPRAASQQEGSSLVNRGGRYFFLRRDAGQNQPVLYYMTERNAKPRPLLDPNTLSTEGIAALLSWTISRDGKTLAYGIARAGSDWQDIHLRDVDSGRDLPDHLEWIKFIGPEWAADGRGIYYGRFPKPDEKNLLTSANYNHQLWYHKLGTSQSQDVLVYERPDHRDWMFSPTVSDDGRYLIIEVSEGTKPENLVFYQQLNGGSGRTVELIRDFTAMYDFIGNKGTRFYFMTTANAEKGRVVFIDVSNGGRATEVVPQTGDVLDQAALAGNTLYLVYQKDVASQVIAWSLDGAEKREVPLPGKGRAHWAERLADNTEQFFSFEGFTSPEMLYGFDTRTSKVTAFEQARLPFDPAAFETRQVFCRSKDGTRIPMFLIGRKGFQPDPKTPVLLYGYGGFNVATTPQYKPMYLQWIELGGVVASANLRGGGEYGRQWHEAGMKANKQNVFDDFIAAAEWLIANKYTSRERLAIYGRSNGGLLVGAVLNQRPDLFGAAVPGVGVMDMLRFHKFTIGYAWTSDYGSPDNPEDFKAIRAYSPLHNIRQGAQYPPTLVLTSDHDDRVVPAHSFKYAAALQHAQEGPAPILIRIETSAGHGGGKPITKQVDETADIISFLEKALGMQ